MAFEEVKVVQTMPSESEVGKLVEEFNKLLDFLDGVTETGGVDSEVKKIKLVK